MLFRSTTTASAADPTTTPPRLTPETHLTLQLLARVTTAIARGELTEWATTGLPSINAIQRYLRCEKRRAQLVWDALRLLDQGHPAPGTPRDFSPVNTHAPTHTTTNRSPQ